MGESVRQRTVVVIGGASGLGAATARLLAEQGDRVVVADLPGTTADGTVDVCLTGAFLVLKHAGRRVADGGSLVTLSSLNARQPGTGLAAYCASKAGIVALTEVAALELGARGVRVNAVAPGLVVTPLTAPAMDVPGVREEYVDNTVLGRPGEPVEIAAACRFLLSDDAAWITGETLDVNGGARLKRYPDLVGLVEQAFA